MEQEHDWEELFVVRDDPRGSGRPEPVYAGIDRCNNCKTLRNVPSTRGEPFRYTTSKMWFTIDEPHCR